MPDGVEQLAARLASDCACLLEPGQRARMENLNRQLREARGQQRRGENEAAREAAARKRLERAAEVFDILDKTPGFVSVTIADPGPDPRRGPTFTTPGDFGALLLRVRYGDGPVGCVVQENDMAQNAGEDATVDVGVTRAGTTWALVVLSNIPAKRSSLLLEFHVAGKVVPWPIDIQAPQSGRLKADIIAQDTGQPTPAMVRLVWKTMQMERPPGNAIEFGPQFDSQGSPSGRRRPRVPGNEGEFYWCVPGPIDTQLPPGDYAIQILHGTEYIPFKDTFVINSGEVLEKRYGLRRWVDMRKFGWYSGDDHVHCRILSDADAARLMSWVQAEDIHVANVVKMGDINRTWFEQRGWGKAYRVIAGDVVLSPGQECPRTHQIGHTISMNTTGMNRNTDHYFLYEEAADAAHEQGGLWGYAHVLSKMFHVDRDMSINVPRGKCDFVELMQFGALGTDYYYDFLNLGFKITASAGSDVPWGGSVGEVRLYACLGDTPFTADAWFDAVKKGRTFTTNGPMIDFRVDEAFPGDEIRAARDRKLHVKARVWGARERMVPVKLEIVRNGDVIKAVESSDPAREELSLDFEVDAAHGFWIAARAYASDGASAHTTPVYVIREGLRFWKFDDLDTLLARRRTSLDEIEKIVAEAVQRKDDARAAGNRTGEQLAVQGAELLKRVEAAREIYSELAKTAERERPIRKN